MSIVFARTAGVSPSGDRVFALYQDDANDPTNSDDDTEDFEVGDRWINLASGSEWLCVDNSTGAAVWVPSAGGNIPNDILRWALGIQATAVGADRAFISWSDVPGVNSATVSVGAPGAGFAPATVQNVSIGNRARISAQHTTPGSTSDTRTWELRNGSNNVIQTLDVDWDDGTLTKSALVDVSPGDQLQISYVDSDATAANAPTDSRVAVELFSVA